MQAIFDHGPAKTGPNGRSAKALHRLTDGNGEIGMCLAHFHYLYFENVCSPDVWLRTSTNSKSHHMQKVYFKLSTLVELKKKSLMDICENAL